MRSGALQLPHQPSSSSLMQQFVVSPFLFQVKTALQEGHGKTNETINYRFIYIIPAALQGGGVIMGEESESKESRG